MCEFVPKALIHVFNSLRQEWGAYLKGVLTWFSNFSLRAGHKESQFYSLSKL